MKFLLLCLLAICVTAADKEVVTWKVTKMLASAPVAAMSDEQAAKLVGTTLQVSANGIHFAGESYPKATLKVTQTSRSEFYNGYKMTGNPLKLPPTVTTEDLGCTTLVKLRPDKSIFYWDGYFYAATREQAKP